MNNSQIFYVGLFSQNKSKLLFISFFPGQPTQATNECSVRFTPI